MLVCLALLNGILIAMSRAMNGHLGKKVGILRTAVWNHVVGFIFLSLVAATFFRSDMTVGFGMPWYAWLGGVLGVAFVALNSHAVPRLGAGRTTSFVVGAQMVVSVLLDSLRQPLSKATIVAAGGAAVIVAGVWIVASARSDKFFRTHPNDVPTVD